MEWLDEVTSQTDSKPNGRVELQGPDDQYSDWKDVEQYLLPDTPLSSSNGQVYDRMDVLSEMIDLGLKPKSSFTKTRASQEPLPVSPPSSTSSLASQDAESTIAADESSMVLTAHGIPPAVRPLLNFVVWRTHHQKDVTAETEKYILVTNDPIIQKQAGKFGVRAKMLTQLSTILAKEGIKPSMNTPDSNGVFTVNGQKKNEEEEEEEADISDDEDRVVFDPSKRPGSSRGPKAQNRNSNPQTANVIDPDQFGRNNKTPTTKVDEHVPPTSPAPSSRGHRGGRGNFQGNNRGHFPIARQANHFGNSPETQRGRGNHAVNGRGPSHNTRTNGFTPNSPRGGSYHNAGRGIVNGVPTGPRGNPSFRARANTMPFGPRGGTSRNQFVQKPIDPDSFTRPSPFGRGRGRGAAMHRLWDPTSNG